MALYDNYFIPGVGVNVTLAQVDEHYNSKSENAQSGKAVAEAIANVEISGGGSGVYVGTEEPKNENVNVWIDLDGEVITFDEVNERLDNISLNKADKNAISLGIASDGLIYLFVDGEPVGTGIPQGTSGDVYGYVDENNAIVLTGNLADGTYIFKYENTDGSATEIGTVTVGNGGDDEPSTPEIHEVDIASIGYTDNARWSTSKGTLTENVPGFVAINLVEFTRPIGKTMTITLSGITWVDTSTNASQILLLVDGVYTADTNMPIKDLPKNYSEFGVAGVLNSDGTVTITLKDGTDGKHYNGLKVCGYGSGANAKITYTIE